VLRKAVEFKIAINTSVAVLVSALAILLAATSTHQLESRLLAFKQ